MKIDVDTKLDLVLKREIEAPIDLVWRGLTDPELVKQWFCPKPWSVSECRIDLRPGGEFYTVMQGPDGEQGEAGASCFLEIVPQQRLVWTTLMLPEYRPKSPPVMNDDGSCEDITFTCDIALKEIENGTQYTAHVMHSTPQQKDKHEAMGFNEGWGTAITQLNDLLQTL